MIPLEKFIIKLIYYKLSGILVILCKICDITQKFLFKRVTKSFQKKIKEIQKTTIKTPNKRKRK